MPKLVNKIRKYKQYIISIVVIIISYVVLLWLFRYLGWNESKIHTWISQFGPYSVIALFAVQFTTSMSPLPDAFLTGIGMVLYGPFWGGLIVWMGMFIAGNVHFFIARKLGKKIIIQKFPEIAKRVDKINKDNMISKITYIRMFQIVTFDITSYIAGIAGATYFQFTASFVLGLLPHLISYAFITQGLFADGSLWNIVPGVAIFVIMFIAYIPKKSKTNIVN